MGRESVLGVSGAGFRGWWDEGNNFGGWICGWWNGASCIWGVHGVHLGLVGQGSILGAEFGTDGMERII